jgi:hypothetical protein
MLKGTQQLVLLTAVNAVHQQKIQLEFEEFARGKNRAEGNKVEGAFEAGKLDPNPQDEDYMFFPFRHLSATTVAGGTWRSTNFSNEKVLKASIKKLEGKPAYTNHHMYVGNEIGVVGDTSWSKSYTTDKGIIVPAGIDAPFIIDSKLHPDICRKLNAKYGKPINSASVTILYEWEASHEFENEDDFYWHLGEVIDGREVQFIATEILDYFESSLVWSGADPFAKIKGPDGKLLGFSQDQLQLPKVSKDDPLFQLMKSGYAYAVDGFSASPETNRIIIPPSSKQDNNTSHNSKDDNKTMEKVMLAIAAKFNVKVEEVTEAMIAQYEFVKSEDFTKTKENAEKQQQLATQVDTLTKEKNTLEEEKKTLEEKVTSLESEKVTLEKHAEVGKKSLESYRSKAKELYTKFAAGKPSEVIQKQIETDSLEILEEKVKMWGGQLYEEFGAKCESCGSDKITMQNSKTDEEGGNSNQGDKPVKRHMAYQVRG